MPQHTVILVRHAKATYGAGTDDKRPLADAGRVQAQKLGAKLRDDIEALDTVFVSTAVRAQQTWQEMAKGAGLTPSTMPRVRIVEEIYSGDPRDIFDMVRLESMGAVSMVVGHEPTISSTAWLIAKDGEAVDVDRGMPTGSAAILRCDREWAKWRSHCATLAKVVHVGHA